MTLISHKLLLFANCMLILQVHTNNLHEGIGRTYESTKNEINSPACARLLSMRQKSQKWS